MPEFPHDRTFVRDGELCFTARVPAFAHLGRRFDELSDASIQSVASGDEQLRWRLLSARLKQLNVDARDLAPESWAGLSRQLEQEFGEAFATARLRVPQPVHEYFQTRQMSLPEYVEWHELANEQTWAMNGGGEGFDMSAFLERTSRLGKLLQTGRYTTQSDQRFQQAASHLQNFMGQSLAQMNQALGIPHPGPTPPPSPPPMAPLQQSAIQELTQQIQQAAARHWDSLRESADFYLRQIEQIPDSSPSAFDSSANDERVSAIPESNHTEPIESADFSSPSSPDSSLDGELLFRCGSRRSISLEQMKLLEDLLRPQDSLLPTIEAALRDMHRWMNPASSPRSPGDRILFPDESESSDTPLNCFRISSITLDPHGAGRILVEFDSLFGHFDEHGCYVSLRNGLVDRYGTWDDVFGETLAESE